MLKCFPKGAPAESCAWAGRAGEASHSVTLPAGQGDSGAEVSPAAAAAPWVSRAVTLPLPCLPSPSRKPSSDGGQFGSHLVLVLKGAPPQWHRGGMLSPPQGPVVWFTPGTVGRCSLSAKWMPSSAWNRVGVPIFSSKSLSLPSKPFVASDIQNHTYSWTRSWRKHLATTDTQVGHIEMISDVPPDVSPDSPFILQAHQCLRSNSRPSFARSEFHSVGLYPVRFKMSPSIQQHQCELPC